MERQLVLLSCADQPLGLRLKGIDMRALTVAVITAFAVATLALSTRAATPPYVYANSVCPASQPWLIGYARFTHKPVCTNVCPALWCYDFNNAKFHRSQRK
jgi:hypothetical protein